MLTSCYGTISFDNPVFYRAPLFQGHPQHNLKSWRTSIEARYAHGVATKSRSKASKKVPLLDLYGPLDLATLGMNVEGASFADTKKYWGKPAAGDKNFYSYLPKRKEPNATVNLHGRLKVEEVDITVRQSLFSGFFVQADLPIRRVSLDRVQFNVAGNNNLSGSVDGLADVERFLQAGDFLNILKEHKFALPKDDAGNAILPTSYHDTLLPEITISGGWQAESSSILNYFEGVRGNVKVGAVLPLGSKKSEDDLLALPLGFNNHIGFMASVQAELDVWSFAVIGAQAGVRLFLSQERTLRLHTDMRQQGWLALQKGAVSVDRGTVWDLSGYIKAEEIIYGLSVAAGYSFVKQEQTVLTLRDSEFLKDFVADEKASGRLVSRDHIINSDGRYCAWDMQTIHLYAQYDGKYHTDSLVAPCVSCAYSYPLTGRRSIITDMLAGSVQLSMVWSF